MKHTPVDIEFDVTNFRANIASNINLREINGTNNIIQKAIMIHPRYSVLIDRIINEIQIRGAINIAFVCNHGKHRSVGWACILKKYYPNSIVRHSGIQN